MPELPEVETVKNILLPQVEGRTINKIDVLRDCTIVGDKNLFISTLENKTIKTLSRIGKFLIFHLSDDVVIVSHLRMEGKYYVMKDNEDNSKYARVVFHLNDGYKICYDDSRCFGIMILTNEKEYKDLKEIKKLGPEPFYVDDVNGIYASSKKSSTPIKSLLLSQELITGLGNIYVDEVLYACKIHPLTQGKFISKKDWGNIIRESKRILSDAIKSGGSTIKSYHPGKGIDGNFQVKLLAYGKEGQPCSYCGNPLKKIKVGGRGTTFCPHCQKIKSDKISIAIYGPVGSGKSTLLNSFKELGATIYSCDEMVEKLYRDEKVINKINTSLKTNFTLPQIDKNELRNNLISNPNNQKKLERIIHPIIKKECEKLIKSYKKGIIAIEVPLLYEANMDAMFDVIIGIKSSNKKLQEKRDLSKASDLKAINNRHDINNNLSKCDYLYINDGSIDDINKFAKKIINTLQDRLD